MTGRLKMGIFKISIALTILISSIATVLGKCTAPKTGITHETNVTSFYPYAQCYDHLTPDHFVSNQTENRQGIVTLSYRWPRGKIPYVLEKSVKKKDKDAIMGGIKLIQASTCLRFAKRKSELNYVTIRTNESSHGCFSRGIGMRGGAQVVNLHNPGCTSYSTAAHELLHAAGLYHEHSRKDRDKFIFVDFNNICTEKASNYDRCGENRLPTESCNSYGFKYNVKSIMHYPGLVTDPTFAVNLKKAIMSSRKGVPPIPKAFNDKITKEDAGKINKMYNNCKGPPQLTKSFLGES